MISDGEFSVKSTYDMLEDLLLEGSKGDVEDRVFKVLWKSPAHQKWLHFLESFFLIVLRLGEIWQCVVLYLTRGFFYVFFFFFVKGRRKLLVVFSFIVT